VNTTVEMTWIQTLLFKPQFSSSFFMKVWVGNTGAKHLVFNPVFFMPEQNTLKLITLLLENEWLEK
jgi:hypothetical protein